jgi:hypothetical protein
MQPGHREQCLQLEARRFGLKIVLDRYSAAATGQRRYFLRPIWDARRAVKVLPGGRYELVMVTLSRRRLASLLPLDDIERLLRRWSEPNACAPARLPWHLAREAGVALSLVAVAGSLNKAQRRLHQCG